MISEKTPPREPHLSLSFALSRPQARAASLKLASLFTALTVVAASFAAIAASQPATAQIQMLDPDLCATTYKPTTGAGDRTETDCRTIVAWRNAAVSNPGSVIGADHLLAQWGTGSKIKFDQWHNQRIGNPRQGVSLESVDGQLVVTTFKMDKMNLAGSLPGELPYIKELRVDKNFFTGGFPTWLYGAQYLEFLDFRSNRFSGTIIGSALNTPKIVNFLVQHNRFSGPVPNFNFAKLSKLTDIRLSNNNFSGDFPVGWSGLADNRGMQRLQVAQNNITGSMPSWISNLKFADTFTPPHIAVGTVRPYYVDFRNNSLCISSGFVLPNFQKLDGSDAPVQAYFGGNNCPTGQPPNALNSPPGENVQFEPVDDSGNPTGLKVTWRRPSGVTGQLTYRVKVHLTVPIIDNRIDRPPYYRYCLGEFFEELSVGPTADEELEITVTRSGCRLQDTRIAFDPTKYTASVTTSSLSGRTLSEGRPAITDDWSVYMADDAQKTYRDVAGVLGLDYLKHIWRWNAVTQTWEQRNQDIQDFASLNLEPGSALAVEKRVLPSWLPLAGLSSADADTPVELQNGWNVLSAGGSATRGVNDNGAFFIDDSLIDCSSAQGAIAILRHVAGTQRFDIELPCHPSREAFTTRGQAFRTIEEINELDTLFIYFRSALPVTVNWDKDNERYAPAS